MGAALQEQWRRVGTPLRPLELATLLAGAARGNFQLTYARWAGANNDPDIVRVRFFKQALPARWRQQGTLTRALTR